MTIYDDAEKKCTVVLPPRRVVLSCFHHNRVLAQKTV